MKRCFVAKRFDTGKGETNSDSIWDTRKRPLGRARRRWENDFRMDIKEIGFNTRIWVGSTQDRNYWRALVNATLKLRVS